MFRQRLLKSFLLKAFFSKWFTFFQKGFLPEFFFLWERKSFLNI